MLAIGNGEKCPYCDSVMENFLIDGKDTFEHLIEKHKSEFESALKAGPKVNKDGVFE